jgi:colanic acid/amylovoran biosynthesis protein
MSLCSRGSRRSCSPNRSGRFASPATSALREICAASPLVLLRDAKSKRNLIEIGVAPQKLTVAADAGFALAEPAALASAAKAKTQVKRVAISVRSWRNFEARSAQEGMGVYRRALANAVEWLVETLDAEIVFVSTCQGIDEYWARDCDVALEIAGDLAPRVRERVSVDQKFHTPEQLLEMIGGFDLVIATRMHMAILALAAGVPVLPIAYEFKTQELFANELGMSEWVLSIDTLTEESIASMLEKFLDNLPNLRPSLFAAVARQHERAIGIGALLHPLGERASLQVGMRLGAAA